MDISKPNLSKPNLSRSTNEPLYPLLIRSTNERDASQNASQNYVFEPPSDKYKAGMLCSTIILHRSYFTFQFLKHAFELLKKR